MLLSAITNCIIHVVELIEFVNVVLCRLESLLFEIDQLRGTQTIINRSKPLFSSHLQILYIILLCYLQPSITHKHTYPLLSGAVDPQRRIRCTGITFCPATPNFFTCLTIHKSSAGHFGGHCCTLSAIHKLTDHQYHWCRFPTDRLATHHQGETIRDTPPPIHHLT